MKRRILSLALASAMVVGPVAGAFAETGSSDEVKTSKPYINGYEDGTFKPQDNVNRAEISKMVAMIQELAEGSQDFSDVASDHWASEFIGAAQSAGIIQGYPDGTFKPSNGLTRAELATIVSRIIEDSEGTSREFSDVEGHWAVEAIDKVSAAGIINGYPDGSFKPDQKVTRAEAVKMLNGGLLNILSVDESISEKVENPFSDIDGNWAKDQILAASTDYDYTLDAEGNLVVVVEEETVELAIESIKAITKTKVEVKLNQEVEAVNAANFEIAGGSVTSATLDEDKKTVTLEVSGLDYDTEYTLVAKEIVIDGEVQEDVSKEFTTLAVTDLWNLVVEPASSSLLADGADNTVVTFKLVDKTTNQVDENADNIVLSLSTTRGTLSNSRVTIQDGQATAILTSEFSNQNRTANLRAEIIETTSDYNELIGQVVGTADVEFRVTDAEEVQTKTLVSAESNQADRVTLFYDKAVNYADFVKTTPIGTYLYNVHAADGSIIASDVTAYTAENLEKQNDGAIVAHSLRDGAIEIDQPLNDKEFIVQGVKLIPGNPNAVEAILVNPNVEGFEPLTDNQEVSVKSRLGVTNSSANFVLTDARVPEVTRVAAEGMNKVIVTFSESVADGNIRFDGTVATNNTLRNATPNLNEVELGEFNARTLQDKRNVAEIVLTDNYDKETYGGPADGYFKAGNHSIQVSSLVDHAYATDNKNMGTTQTLQFNVENDESRPEASVKTQSPEQFIVDFNKTLKGFDEAAVANAEEGVRLEVKDPESGEWDVVAPGTTIDGKEVFKAEQTINIIRIGHSEFKVEVVEDWKDIFTNSNDHYSNYEFRLAVDKDVAVNNANGLGNAALLSLDLSYQGSKLTAVDNSSPVIEDITSTTNLGQYIVTLNEPIKAANLASHTGYQVTGDMVVRFQGKDKDGKTVEFAGKVLGYADAYDKTVLVEWEAANDGSTPQSIVDKGGSTTWTVVATSVSDDIGNTASTLTRDFELEKTPESVAPFSIAAVTYGQGGATSNQIRIRFTSPVVRTGGVNDATSLTQYTLNGRNLPAGTDIHVESDRVVVINVPAGTLAATSANIAGNTDTITVNRNLLSNTGVKLTGNFEWIVSGEWDGEIEEPGDGEEPSEVTGSIEVVTAGVLPGEDLVRVTLSGTETPENYEVSLGGRELTFDENTKSFVGVVRTGSENLVITEKGSEEPGDGEEPAEVAATIEVATAGVLPGEDLVRVTLDTESPENYNVTVDGREATFDSNTGTFVVVVRTGTTADKVVVTAK